MSTPPSRRTKTRRPRRDPTDVDAGVSRRTASARRTKSPPSRSSNFRLRDAIRASELMPSAMQQPIKEMHEPQRTILNKSHELDDPVRPPVGWTHRGWKSFVQSHPDEAAHLHSATWVALLTWPALGTAWATGLAPWEAVLSVASVPAVSIVASHCAGLARLSRSSDAKEMSLKWAALDRIKKSNPAQAIRLSRDLAAHNSRVRSAALRMYVLPAWASASCTVFSMAALVGGAWLRYSVDKDSGAAQVGGTPRLPGSSAGHGESTLNTL